MQAGPAITGIDRAVAMRARRAHLADEGRELLGARRGRPGPLVDRRHRGGRADLEKLRGKALHPCGDSLGLPGIEGAEAREHARGTVELVFRAGDRILERFAHEHNGNLRRR